MTPKSIEAQKSWIAACLQLQSFRLYSHLDRKKLGINSGSRGSESETYDLRINS